MSNGLEETETQLRDYGLIRVTEGEHFDAWNAFWGVEIELQELPMWKQWTDGALGSAIETLGLTLGIAFIPKKRNAILIDAATAVGVLDCPGDAPFPPCTFLNTPWITSLPSTGGRIMVTDEYKRLEARVVECSRSKGHHDVVIAGQTGSGESNTI